MASITASTNDVVPATADWLLIVVPGVIWGASFLFMAEGLRAMDPAGIAFVRILVGALTLGAFPAARRAIPRGEWPMIALMGVLWMAFPLVLFPLAEQRVSSALAGMMNGAVPLFAALVASGLARKAPPRPVLAGLAVGLLGAVLMAWPGMHEGSSSAIGVLMILAAVISYGFALNVARPLQQRNGALPVIWRAQLFALVLTGPVGAPALLHAHWSIGPLLSMLALGSLGTGVAFVMTARAAGRLGSTRASSAAFLIPPVALLLGVVVLGEHVALLSVSGGALCIAGAWLMRR
jgi:drug/metabolite transporter (DMT)-like permease